MILNLQVTARMSVARVIGRRMPWSIESWLRSSRYKPFFDTNENTNGMDQAKGPRMSSPIMAGK